MTRPAPSYSPPPLAVSTQHARQYRQNEADLSQTGEATQRCSQVLCVQNEQADKMKKAAGQEMSAQQIAAAVKTAVRNHHASFRLPSLFRHSRSPETSDTSVRCPSHSYPSFPDS